VLAVRSPTILILSGLIWLLAGSAVPVSAVAQTEPAPLFCKPALQFSNTSVDLPPPADTRGYDVLSYDLELTVDPAERSILGDVLVRLRAVDTGVDFDMVQVLIDLVPELAVSEISDAIGSLTFSHLNNQLMITLRQPLAIGAETSFTISWQGEPQPHGSFRAGLMFRTHDPGTPLDPSDDQPIVANLSQTWSAHSWWPCKDHPADKALVSLAVTIPTGLSAVSNGTLLSVSPAVPGWQRFAWQEQYPLPTYLVSLAISNYESWAEECQTAVGPSVRLEYHVFPFDRPRAEQDLAKTCQMMQLLTDDLGPWPYGNEKYAQVEFKWVGGMEHTTATSLSQLLFTGDGRYENLFLHEMAHQWFGDSLTPATWSDIWLNEGFARYFEALWVEDRYGRQEYLEFMDAIGPQRYPQFFHGAGILSDPDPILPNPLVYDKGAWVLHMLREVVGDGTFFDLIYQYANDPQLVHSSVTTDDLIRVAEAAAGRSLRKFFDPWLTSDLTPVISHTYRVTASGQTSLTLRQNQALLFEVPVPVVVHTLCGDVNATVVLSLEEETFDLTTPCRATGITVAPAGTSLIRTLQSPPPEIVVNGPAPNPKIGRASCRERV